MVEFDSEAFKKVLSLMEPPFVKTTKDFPNYSVPSHLKEIIVRYHTPYFREFGEWLVELIRSKTRLQSRLIDHCNLSPEDFELLDLSNIVSIDKFIADRFKVPYVRVSRVFSMTGDVVSRHYQVPTNLPQKPIIIDSDICTGQAMNAAMRLINASYGFAPLTIEPHQDLIDVEDLIWNNSLMEGDFNISYLLNSEFFNKRTSLPYELYDEVANKARNVILIN